MESFEVSSPWRKGGRERGARSATGQQAHSAWRIVGGQVCSRERGDISEEKTSPAVVLKRMFAGRVKIDASDHLHAGAAQSVGEAARPAEEVDTSHCP